MERPQPNVEQEFDLHLTSEENNKAALIVMESISRAPRSSLQEVFLANKILRGVSATEEESKKKRLVDLKTLASMKPDGDFCAQKTNESHKAHKIPYFVNPQEAGSSVIGASVRGMEYLLKRTWEISLGLNLDVPESLRESSMLSNPNNNEIFSLENVNRKTAFELQDFLKSNKEVLEDLSQIMNIQVELAERQLQ